LKFEKIYFIKICINVHEFKFNYIIKTQWNQTIFQEGAGRRAPKEATSRTGSSALNSKTRKAIGKNPKST
jgi:hypothetical protein